MDDGTSSRFCNTKIVIYTVSRHGGRQCALPQHAEYTEALVQADKDFRQLVYTNRNHSIYGGNTRNHLFRQCLRFFDRTLR